MDSKFLTVAAAGRACEPELTPARIRQLVDSGRIKAVRTSSGTRLIDPGDLKRFIAERRRAAAE